MAEPSEKLERPVNRVKVDKTVVDVSGIDPDEKGFDDQEKPEMVIDDMEDSYGEPERAGSGYSGPVFPVESGSDGVDALVKSIGPHARSLAVELENDVYSAIASLLPRDGRDYRVEFSYSTEGEGSERMVHPSARLIPMTLFGAAWCRHVASLLPSEIEKARQAKSPGRNPDVVPYDVQHPEIVKMPEVRRFSGGQNFQAQQETEQ